jgi:hypothetical protein
MKPVKLKPFDYVQSITHNKKDLMVDDITEKAYLPFIINRSLSYFQDTVLIANEMNIASHIDNRMQYDYYMNIVRKRKRFSKWAKSNGSSDIEVVKQYYGYSEEKARQVLPLLTPDNIKVLQQKVSKGGKGGRK